MWRLRSFKFYYIIFNWGGGGGGKSDRKQNCCFSHAKAQSISLTKFAHAIYRECFSDVKNEEKNP